jgi:probable rRNA maturation factor
LRRIQHRPAIALIVETRLGSGLSRREVTLRLARMMDALKLRDAELSVVLTGDHQIQELNRLYRKKDRPTDVLAFPMEGDASPATTTARGAPRLLGDVIVSVPRARVQAREAGRRVIDEVTMLLAHGVLHLLGWDHDTDAKDRAMRRETDRLCDAAERRKTRHARAQPPHAKSRKLS